MKAEFKSNPTPAQETEYSCLKISPFGNVVLFTRAGTGTLVAVGKYAPGGIGYYTTHWAEAEFRPLTDGESVTLSN